MRFCAAFYAALTVHLAGCQTIIQRPTLLTLNQANTDPVLYRDQLVKVCGMATKQFENVQITEHRGDGWRGTALGLGVHWLEDEPDTDAPIERCVTGYIEPTCGWFENAEYYNGAKPYSREEYEDLICLSTGYSYEWRINQVTLARD